jgi:predicted  nucleic acid-binding Zn-ribbon protein
MRQEEINTLSSTISQLSQQKETLTDNIEQVKNEISEIEEKLYI